MDSRIAWGNRSLHIRVLYGEKARDNDRYHVLFLDALHDIALFVELNIGLLRIGSGYNQVQQHTWTIAVLRWPMG